MKQKTFILLSSLLCGTPIIFLAFRDNEQKNKQKNNLKINQQEIEKKEENKKEKEIISKKEKEKQLITVPKKDKSSSFLFWMIIGIIIIVLIIVGIKIYQRSIKEKKNKFDNFLDDKDAQHEIINNNLEEQEKNINNQNILEDDHQNFVCGVEIDIYGPSKKINIIFCPKFDIDAFFEKFWNFEISNTPNKNYKKLYEFLEQKKEHLEIKNFFHSIMNILQMIDLFILQEIKNEKKGKILLSMANNVIEKKRILATTDITHSNQKNKLFEEAYQKKEYLSCFKINMQSEVFNSPFNYFYNLFFHFIRPIQEELKEFVKLKTDNKHKELLKKLNENQTAINNFLKIE